MKIIIFENILTHYRLNFYNYIVENHDLDIVFLTPSVRNSNGFHTNYHKAKFKIVEVKKINILNFNIFFWPLKYLNSTNIIVSVLQGATLFNILYCFMARLKGVPFFWWGHSRNFAYANRLQKFKDILKLIFIIPSSGMLTYTENESKYVRKQLGFLTPKLISLNNTVRTDLIFDLIKRNDINSISDKYSNNFCIGMVGRLHSRRYADLGINSF